MSSDEIVTEHSLFAGSVEWSLLRCLGARFPILEDPLHHSPELVQVERLHQELGGPFTHGRDDSGHVVERCHEYDVGIAASLTQEAKESNAVEVGHADIGQNDIRAFACDAGERGLGAVGGCHRRGFVRKRFSEGFADYVVVIHDEKTASFHIGQVEGNVRYVSGALPCGQLGTKPRIVGIVLPRVALKIARTHAKVLSGFRLALLMTGEMAR